MANLGEKMLVHSPLPSVEDLRFPALVKWSCASWLKAASAQPPASFIIINHPRYSSALYSSIYLIL